jgi:hypothetical protein
MSACSVGSCAAEPLSRWSRAAPYSLLATKCLYPPEAMHIRVRSDVFWLIIQQLEAAQNIHSCGSFFLKNHVLRVLASASYLVSYCIVSYRVVSCRIVSYHIVSYRIVPYRVRIVLYRIVSHRVVSYCSRSGSIAYYIHTVGFRKAAAQLNMFCSASNAFIHPNPP